MEQGLSLRDKLAMSLKDDLIPELPNQDAIDNVAKYLDIEFDETDFVKMIEFGFAYQSKVRYMYADAMLKEREK